MKKLLFALFAMAVVIGCSKDDNVTSPQEANGQASFLSVNFKAAGSITKAEPGSFEYGSADENAVNSITFYFFDANGNKYAVQGMDNYMTGTLSEGDWAKGTEPEVEKLSGMILVIKQVQDKQIPSQMVAVLNAPADLQKSMSLAELEAAVLDELTVAADNKNFFIMSNSVYVDEQAETRISTTKITEDNLFESNIAEGEPGYNKPGTILPEGSVPQEVKPVDIYVERVAAKVKVQFSGINDQNDFIEVKGEDGKQLTLPKAGSDEEVAAYINVLGWDLTNTTFECNLLKQIETSYDKDVLGFSPWNNPAFCRSYWAETQAEPLHTLTFTDLIDQDIDAAKYYFENTMQPATETNGVNVEIVDGKVQFVKSDAEDANKASQLVVAAQLVDQSGNALPFGRWYGKNYLVDDLKAAMVATVDHRLFILESTDEQGNKKFRPIQVGDVSFQQMSVTESKGRYKVYMTAYDNIPYYDATGAEMKTADAAYILEHVDPAQIWADGHTYYYATIKHFGDAIGIVRNHCYVLTIDSVTGFGTPVFDDGFVITPEKPEDSEATNLSATINILSWHLVEQNINL
ncbi:MAG: hypothetical protein E7119_06545 [Bacteroidales bacterium]|nr:hypothetical protein [Bacteroidales bacterium]